ncbi:MAG TPA: hypothetical protein VHX62_18685 [Solirubrobacteraceae bacterium]|nr:hypothetical protein [Solirubrobacteraceae bacterium]
MPAVGAAGTGAEAEGIRVTGGAALTDGACGAVLVTTGADASARARPRIVATRPAAAGVPLAGRAINEWRLWMIGTCRVPVIIRERVVPVRDGRPWIDRAAEAAVRATRRDAPDPVLNRGRTLTAAAGSPGVAKTGRRGTGTSTSGTPTMMLGGSTIDLTVAVNRAP